MGLIIAEERKKRWRGFVSLTSCVTNEEVKSCWLVLQSNVVVHSEAYAQNASINERYLSDSARCLKCEHARWNNDAQVQDLFKCLITERA